MVDLRQQEDVEPTIESTGEDTLDELDLEHEEATHKDKLQAVKKKLKACEAEKSEILEQLQRTKAEFLNARKRLEEEQLRTKERLIDDHIEKLLPLCDSFHLAMSNQEVWQRVDENWRKGIEGISTQLQSLLKEYGATSFDPTGEHFDHHRHEAVGSEDSEGESDTVVKVLQLGYERNGNLIRPAKVIISN